MSKYTNEELQTMCKSYLEREQQGDDRCGFFLMFMAMNTGMNQQRLRSGIQNMAKHGSWE